MFQLGLFASHTPYIVMILAYIFIQTTHLVGYHNPDQTENTEDPETLYEPGLPQFEWSQRNQIDIQKISFSLDFQDTDFAVFLPPEILKVKASRYRHHPDVSCPCYLSRPPPSKVLSDLF